MNINNTPHPKYPEAILIRDFHNNVGVNDIIDSWQQLFSHNLITPEVKGIINNLTGCQLNLELDSFQKLMAYLKSKAEITIIKLAVVCDSSENIVFPIMGENLHTDLNIKPFSTFEAAEKWIMSGA